MLISLVISQTLHAAGLLYFVNTTSDTVVAGACPNGQANCSLRGAIQASNSHPGEDGIEIDLPAGSVINLTQTLPDITDSVGIYGPGANNLTVRRDTGGNYRIFHVTTAAAVTLSGMTISGGLIVGSQENGAGILHSNASGLLNIANCAVLNNSGEGNGGGVYSEGNLSVTSSAFNGNIAAFRGGAIYHRDSALSVTNCNLTDNSAGREGGAIFSQLSLMMTVTTCVITNNHAGGLPIIFFCSGGGIAIRGDGFSSFTTTINNCVVRDNSALGGGQMGSPGSGGGIFVSGRDVDVFNSTFAGNYATGGDSNPAAGGAVLVADSFFNLTSCTISGNSAERGGAIYGNFGGGFDLDGRLTVTNCTISGNDAANSPYNSFGGVGGGISLQNQGGANHTPQIKSSIIALNRGHMSVPDLDGTFETHGFNLIGSNEGAAASFPAGNPNASNDIVGTSAAPVDPRLDPNGLQNNGGPTETIALLSNSPAIDKGTSNGLTGMLTTDQRGPGFSRLLDYSLIANATGGDGTDIGAFEFGGPLVPISVSRKMHGALNFDIPLPPAGPVAVECRTGGGSGNHQLVLNFPAQVSLTSASVTTGTGSVSNYSVNGSNVTVNLTGVTNAQTIVATLFGVSDGTNTTNITIPMGLLVGDTTGNGSANASDVSQTKARSGQAVDATNFRSDVTVNGSINASDVSLVKSKSGTALP